MKEFPVVPPWTTAVQSIVTEIVTQLVFRLNRMSYYLLSEIGANLIDGRIDLTLRDDTSLPTS